MQRSNSAGYADLECGGMTPIGADESDVTADKTSIPILAKG